MAALDPVRIAIGSQRQQMVRAIATPMQIAFRKSKQRWIPTLQAGGDDQSV
jgi:hypothetical protein